MRYVEARLEQYCRDETYRIYIADTLYYQGQGQHITARYGQLFDQAQVQDSRTGDEIAADTIMGAGLILKGDE